MDWFLYNSDLLHETVKTNFRKERSLSKKQLIFFALLYQKMKFSIKDFFSKSDQTLNGKIHFLCSAV